MYSKQLKNSILQQAIQGKLVKQIATEGTAKELLEGIRKEKAKLIKEEKIKQNKKDKELKPITKEEIPFEIPSSWEWVRLGEIVNVNGGYAFKSSNLTKNKNNNYVRVIRISDFDEKGIKDINKVYYEYNNIFEEFKLENDNIIVAMTGGTVGKNFLISNIQENMYCNQRVATIKPINNSVIKYIGYIINSQYIQEIINKNKNSTNDNISIPLINNFLVPLPPLQEQQRIVKKIESLEPLLKDFEENETKLNEIEANFPEQLKNSILQQAIQGKLVKQIPAEGTAKELLEEIKREKAKLIKERKIKQNQKDKELKPITKEEIPFEIPSSWEWTRLGEVCSLYTGDSIAENIKKIKYTNLEKGYNYIGTKDISFNQKINYNNGIKIPFEEKNFLYANKNDVLLCIEGGSAGRKITILNEKVCFGNKLCCIHSYINGLYKYIFYFIQSLAFYSVFNSNINGIIGGVSINKMKELILPLPPLQEQQRIVEKVDKILKEIDLMEN